MQLKIGTERLGSVGVVRCEGRMVYGPETDAVMKAASALNTSGARLVIDMSAVRAIDSCGIGVLVGIMVSARNRGGDLRVANPSAKVSDVLRVTGLHSVFSHFESVEDAVASYGKASVVAIA